ncbi:MAG: hypothetical protein WC603_00570 [Candidatus Paceibacterota bacterium]|jgi:hypothetical protein
MLKHEEIFEGQIILSDYQHSQKTVGIIRNVQNAIESGKRGPHNDPKELSYDIFFPETGRTKNVCEHSGVTSEAVVMKGDEAEIFILRIVNKNEKKILRLRKINIAVRNAFTEIFQKSSVP